MGQKSTDSTFERVLPPDQQANLQAEEYYRAEGRHAHQVQTSRGWARFWSIANSPIIMWLVTGLAVTIISTHLQNRSATRELREARKGQVNRLGIEVKHRLDYLRPRIEEAWVNDGEPEGTAFPDTLRKAKDLILSGQDGNWEIYAFAENKKRSLDSILLEQKLLLESFPDSESASDLLGRCNLAMNWVRGALSKIRSEIGAEETKALRDELLLSLETFCVGKWVLEDEY